MRKSRFLSFVLSALLLLALVSCNEKDKDAEPSARDLLISGTWTGSKLHVAGQDVTQLYKAETGYDMTKTILKFDKTGTYTETYEHQIVSGKWEFSTDGKHIIYNKGSKDEFSATIKALSSGQLILTQEPVAEDQPLVVEFKSKTI